MESQQSHEEDGIMKKFHDDKLAVSCFTYGTSPDQLRRIAERMEQQARDYTQAGQYILYQPVDQLCFAWMPDKQALLRDMSNENNGK